jgi:hypothetical protein
LIPDGSRTYFSVGFVNGRDRVVIEPKIDATLLFSLDDDPAEENDLAEAEPDRLARHLAVFRAFMQERGMAPSDYGLK